jgi:hypothetical protein
MKRQKTDYGSTTYVVMKNVFFCFLLIPVMGWSQSSCGSWNNGVLRAEVTGDTVTLHNDTAYRNCGAMYQMKTGFIGDTLIWLQVDTGWVFGCMCHFNLSLTLDSMKTGSYAAKVYYTTYPPNYYPPDTCLAGIITFEVTKPNANLSLRKAGEGQSPCYSLPVGMGEVSQARAEEMELFPNPVGDVLFFRTSTNGMQEIVISDMHGMTMVKWKVNGDEARIPVSSLAPGVYVLTATTATGIGVKRFIKAK